MKKFRVAFYIEVDAEGVAAGDALHRIEAGLIEEGKAFSVKAPVGPVTEGHVHKLIYLTGREL